MSKYPKVDVKSKKKNDGYRATAQSKVPCGVTVVAIREHKDQWVAELYAKRECKGDAEAHILTHKCK